MIISIDKKEHSSSLMIPAHLSESFNGIAAHGEYVTELLFEEIINMQGKINSMLQKGVSSNTLNEAYEEVLSEGLFSTFIDKVIGMFRKIIDYIKELFRKFLDWIKGKSKSSDSSSSTSSKNENEDKEIKELEKIVVNVKIPKFDLDELLKDFEYNLYKWDIVPPPANIVDNTAGVIMNQNLLESIVILESKQAKRRVIKPVQPSVSPEDTTADEDGEEDITSKYTHKLTPEETEKLKQVKKVGEIDREKYVEKAVDMVAKELGMSEGMEDKNIVTGYYYKLRGGHLPEKHKGIKYAEVVAKSKFDSSKESAAAKTLFKGLVSGYEKIISKLEEMKKANEDDYVISTIASIKLAAIKRQSGIINQCSSQYLTAIRDRDRDYSVLHGLALVHINKKKAQTYEKLRQELKRKK